MESSTRQRPAFCQVEAETRLIYELVCSHGLEFAAAFRIDFGQVIARFWTTSKTLQRTLVVPTIRPSTTARDVVPGNICAHLVFSP